MSNNVKPFAARVLQWAKKHGRTQLPWQENKSAYRVWVSEIMLQQTQVETVTPYFEKFMHQFPTINTLASASQDQVLHYWSGLGYYARARNLHKAAKLIHEDFQGEFPEEIKEVVALPGIGRSTAAAILSLSFDQPHAILDGNVKRVLARHQAIEGWPGNAKVEKQLWAIAEQLTPTENNALYTQSMMDLGATICKRAKPECPQCPVNEDCIALAENRQQELPHKKPKKAIPSKHTVMLAVINPKSGLLMQRRPNHGIWGGLWSLPEFDCEKSAVDWCLRTFRASPSSQQRLASFTHTFSHFRLKITPLAIEYDNPSHWVMEGEDWVWYKNGSSQAGFAAPVEQLIKQLAI